MLNLVKKYKGYALYVYTMLLLAINSIRIFSDSIWGDEAFSIRLVRRGTEYILYKTAKDVHPPLYYLILEFFSKIFEPSAMIGKFVSFLPIVFVCIVAVTYIKKKFGAGVAMIIVGVVTFTGNCVPMIVEVRMYTWALFFAFMNMVCINELLSAQEEKGKKRFWIGHCVWSLFAAYTHYYALILIAFMDATLYIMLFIKNKKVWKKCLLSMTAMILAYLPWLRILLEQFKSTSNSFWIQDIDIKSSILYLFGQDRWGKILLLVFLFSILCFYFTKEGFDIKHSKIGKKNQAVVDWEWKFSCSSDEQKLILLNMIATFGTIFVGIAVSWLIRPMYLERYIFPAIGLVAFSLGIAYRKCFKNIFFLLLLLVVMTFSGKTQFMDVYQKELTYLTEETKNYMQENMLEGDIILADDDSFSWTVLEYYFPQTESFHCNNWKIDEEGQSRVWLMKSKDETALSVYEAAGYRVEEKANLGLDRVFFKLYLLEK